MVNRKQYKTAMIQMDCAFLDTKVNTKKAEALIEEAAGKGAALICLPEAFNTGYLGTDIPGMREHAERLDGPTIRVMQAAAKRLGIYLVAPIILLAEGDRVENTAVFIDDEGEILGTYSKTHPVGDERTYFNRGVDYPVWETKLGKIGIVICYDACFPETTRILTLRGAELVIVPAAWRASAYFKEWWDLNLACRALDNLVYVAAVNRCGICGDERFAGKSQVIDPVGRVLAMAGVEEETILYQEIDLDNIAREREFNTVLLDRHPEDYRLLSEL